MNYETLDLAITKEEARDLVEERIGGVHVREFHGYYEFTSPFGYHLAELSDLTLPSGERGARLKYRTAMISPVAARARAKARQIKNEVEQYRYKAR